MVEVKTEIEGIYRDVNNGALLNKDNSALGAYKKMKQKNNELEQMKSKVNSLDEEIKDVKNLLNQILEKLS
jgi:hypothetical protein